MNRSPTFRQLELVRLIYNYTKRNSYPPTRRELALMMGVASVNNISDLLKCLTRDKLIVALPRVARGLRVTEEGQRAIGVIV